MDIIKENFNLFNFIFELSKFTLKLSKYCIYKTFSFSFSSTKTSIKKCFNAVKTVRSFCFHLKDKYHLINKTNKLNNIKRRKRKYKNIRPEGFILHIFINFIY